MITINVECTDTFGGEANYSWVHRATVTAPDNASDKLIMRKARNAAGWEGVKGRWETYGDQMTFRPYRRCVVMFVTVRD